MNILKEKVAIITGASRGIGKAILKKFASEGCFVVAVNRNPDTGKSVIDEIKKSGGNGISISADISKKADCEKIIAKTIEERKKIDILINNAGITADNLFMRMKDDEWETVINTNLNSVFYLTRPAIKYMIKARSGRIVTISSVVGHTGNPGQVNYCSAKSALIGFTKSLAKEVASRNILCNVISPGFIDTDMTVKLNDDQKKFIVNNIPLKRIGSADDIANAALFLSSDQSSYITGTVLHVNGGLY